MPIAVFCDSHTPKLELTLSDDLGESSLSCPKCGRVIPVPRPAASRASASPSVSRPALASLKFPGPNADPIPTPSGHSPRLARTNTLPLIVAAVGLLALGVSAGIVIGRATFQTREKGNRPDTATIAPQTPARAAEPPRKSADTARVENAEAPRPSSRTPVAPDSAAREKNIRLLALALKDPAPENKIRALEQLAAFGTEANAVGAEMIEAMRDDTQPVRDAASEAFERVNPKIHEYAFTIIRGANKWQALNALSRAGSDAEIVIPLLHYWAEHPNAFGDLYAAGFVLHTSGPRDVPVDYFQWEVYDAIARIDPRDAQLGRAILSAIRRTISESDSDAVAARARGIRHLNRSRATNEEKVSALLAALDDGVQAPLVIDTLGDLGRDAAVALPALKKLKQSSDDTIRGMAKTAIARIESAARP